MRKIIKIVAIVISIVAVLLILFFINLLQKEKCKSNEQGYITENSIAPVNEITNTTNEIDENTTVSENLIATTNIMENTTQNLTETKEKEEQKQDLKNTTTNTSKNTSKKVVTQTKEENSQSKEVSKPTNPIPTTPTNTTPSNKEINSSSNTTPVKQEDTIKRITKVELDAEKSKFLNDIKSIRPGLKYVYSKRGQVFWPYRSSEIEIAVGNVSFGTVYYYVDTFVEGNQEKFKYYIDWAGN